MRRIIGIGIISGISAVLIYYYSVFKIKKSIIKLRWLNRRSRCLGIEEKDLRDRN